MADQNRLGELHSGVFEAQLSNINALLEGCGLLIRLCTAEQDVADCRESLLQRHLLGFSATTKEIE